MNEPAHLTDDVLNEYLDEALSGELRATADNHLRACMTCTGRLAELSELFSMLNGLPEVPLERDISPHVVDSLKSRTRAETASLSNPAVRLGVVLAVEVVGALALIGLVWPEALDWVSKAAGANAMGPFTALLDEAARISYSLSVGQPFEALLSSLRAPSIPWASASALVTLLGTAAVAWLVSNGILLRAQRPTSDRSNR